MQSLSLFFPFSLFLSLSLSFSFCLTHTLSLSLSCNTRLRVDVSTDAEYFVEAHTEKKYPLSFRSHFASPYISGSYNVLYIHLHAKQTPFACYTAFHTCHSPLIHHNTIYFDMRRSLCSFRQSSSLFTLFVFRFENFRGKNENDCFYAF